MKTMLKMLCLTLTAVLLLGCLIGCSSSPVKPSGDQQTTKTTEPLTIDEQEVFDMLDLVNELSVGMKNTASMAVVKAAALLDMCEKTTIDTETVTATAKKYYDTFGSEFKMMFDEKFRNVYNASESLRDEATRAATMQEAGAASEVTWTAKSFDMVKSMYDAINE